MVRSMCTSFGEECIIPCSVFSGFPESQSTIQCYRVLGNSLNVHVVAVLIQILTTASDSNTSASDSGNTSLPPDNTRTDSVAVSS